MKLMVIGGGGREHAIIKSLKKNPEVETIYALPGNGGIGQDAICVPIGAKDIPAMVAFAQEKEIDFAVVAPDDPLVLGAVDALEAVGVPCFGPNRDAAILEGSKVFSKGLMQKYHIPTAKYQVFSAAEEAIAYLKAEDTYPAVIKADGLALGKGVIIAENEQEAIAGVHRIMTEKAFGDSGNQVVIEEFLTGPEVSVLSFTDGKTIIPMVSSMDHKRALDGDQGLNTGGMGTIAPNPFYTEAVAKECMETIFLPTMQAMVQEGRPFKGCLYFGLMLTQKGPRVIEYNCRFGDPETQVVLPLLKSDLLTIMQAVHDERLAEVPVEFSDGAACCVVVASGGYPQKYQSGYPISFGAVDEMENITVFHAGTKLGESGEILTSGGRVLGVTATGGHWQEAKEKAYEAVKQISFTDMFYRKDIGARCK
ncbi:MAG: phosphoribosylamine--glycine ligase [Oscillospiraceae bacterium]|nr:phosphoribosylamine--glycine ligase [Oscillospiraceae bacterium]